MALYKTTGIVLSGFRLGEADKIVGVLTADRGKVRAVAKGVRKTKSRFGGRLEPLGHVALVMYAGRSLDTVTQVETVDSFRALREDLDRLAVAGSMAEAADRFVQGAEESGLVYKLLLAGLRELDVRPPGRFLLTGFLLRMLELNGTGMAVGGECVSCGSPPTGAGHRRIGIAEGGSLCERCGRSAYRVEPETVRLLSVLSGAKMVGANALTGPPEVAAEAQAATLKFFEYHVDRALKSVSLALSGHNS